MGMFDYIRCEMPLPETADAPPDEMFQTKDTPDQYMTVYTITADGRLSWRPYRMEEVPKTERPHPDAPDDSIMAMIGCIRRVEQEPEILHEFHGDVDFYTYGPSGRWWEYRARFSEGVCSGIHLIEFRPATPPADREARGMFRPGWWISPLIIMAVAFWAAVALAAPVTITRDMGGSIREREAQIKHLRQSGAQVRITGICKSSCTMMLSVACVTPEARLSFHGPSSSIGIPLPADDFDRISRQMAAHYPPAIRTWFMAEARFVTGRDNFKTITGAEAIKHGVSQCEERQ